MLPPLIVEETTSPLRWRYFAMPGREVLSATADARASAVVERIRLLDHSLTSLIPERFLAKPGLVPETLVLLNQENLPGPTRTLLDDAAKKVNTRVRFIPNLALGDLDAATTLAVPARGLDDFIYTEGRINGLLRRRTPQLPEWFIQGMGGFYRRLGFVGREIKILPIVWGSREESDRRRRESALPRLLLPFEEMLTRRPPPNSTADVDVTWRDQSTLFLYWALQGGGSSRREALWRFLDRLDREPVSEALVVEHFGLAYADMRAALSDYLATALIARNDPLLVAPRRPQLAPPEFRPATPAEITRIRGDLERLEVEHVRPQAAHLADIYAEQARRTLRGVYSGEERDPQILAIAGLLELEAGQPETALPFLEAAVQANVLRPRAYLELARLRYAALVKTVGQQADLTPAQVDSIAGPLLTGAQQAPALVGIHTLLAVVLTRGSQAPSMAQLAALHDGARTFAHAPGLVAQTILLHRAAGQSAAAMVLAREGMLRAPDDAARARIEAAAGGAVATEGARTQR